MAGAGYDLVVALGEGDTWLVHGPRATQSFLWVASARPTEGSGLRRARMGLELSVARWSAQDSAPAFVMTVGLVLGVGL
jgi:hypothetical protein